MDDSGSPSNTELERDPNSEKASTKDVGEADAGTSDEEPATGEGLSEEVYEVEKIIDHKDTEEGLFYLVRWKGFTESDDSWEPAENLSLALRAIADYEISTKANSKRRTKSSSKSIKSINRKFSIKKRTMSKPSKKRNKKAGTLNKHTDSGPGPYVPTRGDLNNDDSDCSETTKSKKRSRAVTKAALKSYPQITPKNRLSNCSIPPSETLSAAKKALQMRQSWLYESDSDEDSGTEKENGKRMERRKIIEQQREKIEQGYKRRQNQKEDCSDKCSDIMRGKTRKRQGEKINLENSKKLKMEQQGCSNEMGSEAFSEEAENCVTTSYGNESSKEEQQQIFAIGKLSDGRIRVLIGTEGAKKVVSLRDAHDINSWGLLQHILQYAVFENLE